MFASDNLPMTYRRPFLANPDDLGQKAGDLPITYRRPTDDPGQHTPARIFRRPTDNLPITSGDTPFPLRGVRAPVRMHAHTGARARVCDAENSQALEFSDDRISFRAPERVRAFEQWSEVSSARRGFTYTPGRHGKPVGELADRVRGLRSGDAHLQPGNEGAGRATLRTASEAGRQSPLNRGLARDAMAWAGMGRER